MNRGRARVIPSDGLGIRTRDLLQEYRGQATAQGWRTQAGAKEAPLEWHPGQSAGNRSRVIVTSEYLERLRDRLNSGQFLIVVDQITRGICFNLETLPDRV